MNLLDSINQFIRLFLDTIRQVGRGRIWLTLFAYFAFQWLILYAHYDFLRPPFYDLISGWTALFGSDLATVFSHYPQHFLLLGRFSGWAKLAVGVIAEGLVLGLVAQMFHRRFTGSAPPGSSLWPGRWFDLVVVWVVINGLLAAAGMVLPDLLRPLLSGPRRLLAFSFVFMPLVYTLIFSLFFVAIPSVVVNGLHGPAALWKSVRMFFHRPFTFFGLAMVILSVPILLGALAGRPSGIVESFKPELVYWLLSASLLVEMIAFFFWMGTSVRFLTEAET